MTTGTIPVKAATRPGAASATLSRQLRFDWVMTGINFWIIGGAFLDGWAHNHVPALETFFTPWHGVLYSGLLMALSFLSIVLIANHRRGADWREALPAGYNLSLVGVGIFALAGVGDMLWHIAFGIEKNVEALLSPTHLLLAIGASLITTGPVRAAWRRSEKDLSPVAYLPMLISLGLMVAIFGFFTQYANPFGETYVATQYGQNLRSGSMDLVQGRGLMAFFVQAATLVATAMLLVRRFKKLPLGSFTLIFTLLVTLMTLMRDNHLTAIPAVFILAALIAGALVDGLRLWLKPTAERPGQFRLFATALPLIFYGLYFLAVALTGGIWWSLPMWTGTLVLVGGVGYLLSFLALPPRISYPEEAAE